MMRELVLAASLSALLSGQALADLSRARAEQNPERRARLAWENAGTQVKLASKTYAGGDWEATVRALEEALESLELARQSLETAVKNPRNSRSYKNFEVRTRDVLKHLGALHERMLFEERQQIESVIEKIRKIHDDALWAVMGGRPAEKPQ